MGVGAAAAPGPGRALYRALRRTAVAGEPQTRGTQSRDVPRALGWQALVVCAFTKEIRAACCCPTRKAESEGPAIAARCCCRTVLVDSLPEAAPAERSDSAAGVADPPLVSLALATAVPTLSPD